MTERHLHWETIYQNKEFEACSWYQDIPKTSLELIAALELQKDASIIDVGGGESYLTAFLDKKGFSQLSVLDISPTALKKSQKKMGGNAAKVTWILSDVTHFETERHYDLWHDRAAFHFLRDPEDITAYIATAGRRIRSGGYAIIGTFSPQGPTQCSGITIQQYSTDALAECFKVDFNLIASQENSHQTPFDTKQAFSFCTFQRK